MDIRKSLVKLSGLNASQVCGRRAVHGYRYINNQDFRWPTVIMPEIVTMRNLFISSSFSCFNIDNYMRNCNVKLIINA